MNEFDKTELISRIAKEMWNKGLIHIADDLMYADAKYYGPHLPNGIGSREDWKQAVTMYRTAFPDSHVTYEDMIETADTVIGRWSATGTNTGNLGPLPPTGKPIKITGITIYKFKDNKISEAWEQLDMLGMWQQLGILKPPGSH